MARGKSSGGLRAIFDAAYRERFGARYLGRVLHDVLQTVGLVQQQPLGDDIAADPEVLTKAFKVFDRNNDGFVCVQELQLVLKSLGLKEGRHEKKCQKMIADADADGDGKLNFEEFKKFSSLMRR